MVDEVRFSQVIEGYFLAARARRLSANTLANYAYGFRRFAVWLGEDQVLARVTAGDVRAFLGSLEELAPKSILNIHVALSSLWTWAVGEGLAESNVVREVTPPKPDRKEILPYSKEDLRAMLRACERTRGYSRPGKVRCNNRRPTALRDKAMILLLVDTGIRATELCELRVYQVDLRNERLTVMGKGRRERMLPISARTGQAIWRYLATREGAATQGSQQAATAGMLFVTGPGRPMDRNHLRRMLKRAGERGGVQGVTVHRFRHTFAIEFLRNGGNAFALQRMLGHSSLEMVRRYLAIAEADVESAHRNASPVANWVL